MTGAFAEIDQGASWSMVALATVALAYFLLRSFKKTKDPLEAPSSFATVAQHRATERAMQDLLVELADMSRQISSQLGTRAKKLELLLEQADQKIAQLQQAAATPSPVGVVSHNPLSEASDPMTDRIYALADQGKGSREIASALACPPGEVELILALRGRSHAA